ncbi:hypothetical protein BCR44DRAFT_1427305, partial [Catenaria anguillulae PL171]
MWGVWQRHEMVRQLGRWDCSCGCGWVVGGSWALDFWSLHRAEHLAPAVFLDIFIGPSFTSGSKLFCRESRACRNGHVPTAILARR